MTNFLIRLFVKNYENTDNSQVRTNYGVLSAIVCLLLNVFLGISKVVVGSISNSVSIVADGINNFGDIGSNIVTLFGFKASNKPADEEHPYGHGRIEYISALIVGFVVIAMAIELLRTSYEQIVSPEPVKFSWIALVVMIVSVFVKLWMAVFNRKIAKTIGSVANTAIVADSLSDVLATSVAMIALIASNFTSAPIDGYAGVAVSLFIAYSGYSIIRETVSPLLGERPDPEFVKEIESFILSNDDVLGVHHLIIHNYGPSRKFATVDVELSSNIGLMKAHLLSDKLEKDLLSKYGLITSIHVDPLKVGDEFTDAIKGFVEKELSIFDSSLVMHDFRASKEKGSDNVVVSFLVVKSVESPLTEKEIIDYMTNIVEHQNEHYVVKITITDDFS